MTRENDEAARSEEVAAEQLRDWRRRGRALTATVSSPDGESREVDVYTRSLDLRQRSLRAALALASCWALAGFSILIPLAHFVLVPGFLLAGPFLAWRRFGQQHLVLGALVSCPRCATQTLLEPCAVNWPLELSCQGCRACLSITQAD